MDSERWKKLEDVYQVALPMNQSERGAYLKGVCAEDDELQRDAETLLAFADPTEDFLQGNASTLVFEVLAHEGIRTAEMRLLTVGDVLDGRYEVLEELRGGGMGSVYRAHDRRLGWTVAVKVLKEDALKNGWAVDKFRQEQAALAQIDHPNVVRLVDAGELQNGAPYLVMMYVEGADLSQILEAAGGSLEGERVALIMQQAGHGVAALHDAGLVHRDLKPGNFVVADNDQKFPVKVVDLGIVRVLGTNTRLDQIPGTPRYLSPEQLHGQDVTPASDVYALGVTAYELLTGKPLFDLQDAPLAELLVRLILCQQSVVRCSPEQLLPARPDAARVILKALALNPNQRPKAQEFGDELAQTLTSLSVSTAFEGRQPVSRIRHSVNWLTLTKRRLITIAVILVAILGMTSWGVSVLVNGRPWRTLTYWVTIVREGDGKTTRATGRETFDTGDRFRFNITPAQASALYIFNEGASGDWNLIFPTRKNHQGVAWLEALENVETKECEFTNWTGKETGREKIWIVWAAARVKPLDEIVQELAKADQYDLTVPGASQHAIFLGQFMAEHRAPPSEVTLDQDQSQVTLKSHGESLVYFLELEHKDWK